MQQTKRTPGSLLGGLSVLALCAGVLCPATTAQAQSAHARITADQAKAAALKKYPGKVEGKINLEDEEGSWQYAVNIRSGKTLREVMVDARTGKIANVEVTSKAEEAREQKAEADKKAHSHPHAKPHNKH
jgi:hypothetical protein